MKVLALNSSLRQDGESRTELMLNHLVKGMREAGAEVEVLNLRDKTIHYCMGCFMRHHNPWPVHNPGRHGPGALS